MQYSSGTLNTLKKETIISAKKVLLRKKRNSGTSLAMFPFFWPCRAACICIVRVRAQSLQSCPTVCDPMDCSPPGSSVHGILQGEYWSGLPRPPPGDLPNPETEPGSPVIAGRFFTTELPVKFFKTLKSMVCFILDFM